MSTSPPEASPDVLVSIIIAAYNAEAYIKNAIVSACNQTHRNIEVLVVDDGSADRTRDIITELARQDERITPIFCPQNIGVSAARNLAIERARGEWIGILDADDTLHPNRLERLLLFASHHQLDLAADNLEMRDFKTGAAKGFAFPSSWMNPHEDVTLTVFLERDMPGIFTRELGFMKPIIRRGFLVRHGLRYETGVWAGEDFLLYIQCLMRGAKLRLLPEALYIYSLRQGSASSGRNATVEIQRINRRLLRSDLARVPEVRALLSLRRVLLDYELFSWHLRSQKFTRAALIAARLPSAFLWSKLAVAAMRRFGSSPANPSEQALARLKTRRPSSLRAGRAA